MDRRINKVKNDLRGLGSLTSKIGLAYAGLGAGIGFLLKKAGDFEQIQIAFEVLLQSVGKAKTLTKDLLDFAIKTPFRIGDVFKGAKQLLAYNIASEKLIPTLTALGNVAAGVGKDKLPNLILAFGQVATAGKLRGQEIRQFTEAGVPILEAVAKEMGVAQDAVQGLVSKGAVKFATVEAALQNLANGSGRFTGLMEKQSHTLLGVWSNFQDLIQLTSITIGNSLLPEAKGYLNIAIKWVEANKKLVQSKVIGFIRVVVNGMKQMVKVGLAIGHVLGAAITALGGFENAARLATTALTLFVAVRVLGFFGDIGIAALSAAKNLGMFILQSRSAAFALLSLKATALAIPLAIGAALAGIFLLIEDVIAFFQGRDSLVGRLINNFDEGAPKFLKALDNFEQKIVGKVKEIVGKITEFLTADAFAPDRQKLAEALLSALDIALQTSAVLTRIGFKIGEAIFDGIVEVFANRAPLLASALGITSKKNQKKKFDLKQHENQVGQAADFIKRFGLEQTSQVFPLEVISQAQKLVESQSSFSGNPSIQKALKQFSNPKSPLFNPNLVSALKNGSITMQELQQKGVASGLNRLRRETGFNVRSLLPGLSGKLGGGAGGGNPVNVSNVVNINGTNLSEDQLKNAVGGALKESMDNTMRESHRTLKPAIAE